MYMHMYFIDGIRYMQYVYTALALNFVGLKVSQVAKRVSYIRDYIIFCCCTKFLQI